jgi:hypothetical protein
MSIHPRCIARWAIVGLLVMGGCGPQGGMGRTQAAVTGIQETRRQIDQTAAQIDRTMVALNALPTAGDLKAAFDTYKKEVDRTNTLAMKVKTQAADMHERGRDYVEQWRAEMANVSNPDLNETAQARSESVKQRFLIIRDSFTETSEAYNKLYSDLSGIRAYLSNDLTPAGVKAIAPIIDRANADREELRQKGNAARSALDELAGALSAGPTTR